MKFFSACKVFMPLTPDLWFMMRNLLSLNWLSLIRNILFCFLFFFYCFLFCLSVIFPVFIVYMSILIYNVSFSPLSLTSFARILLHLSFQRISLWILLFFVFFSHSLIFTVYFFFPSCFLSLLCCSCFSFLSEQFSLYLKLQILLYLLSSTNFNTLPFHWNSK